MSDETNVNVVTCRCWCLSSVRIHQNLLIILQLKIWINRLCVWMTKNRLPIKIWLCEPDALANYNLRNKQIMWTHRRQSDTRASREQMRAHWSIYYYVRIETRARDSVRIKNDILCNNHKLSAIWAFTGLSPPIWKCKCKTENDNTTSTWTTCWLTLQRGLNRISPLKECWRNCFSW